MSDAVLAILLLSAIGIGIVAAHVSQWLSVRKWRRHEELDFLTGEGFRPVSDRWLTDSRIMRYTGFKRGTDVHVESGCGPSEIYARVDVDFIDEVQLGVRISSEHEEGLLTRILRLREVEIGRRHFDDRFILLTRNEDRLKTLLDPDLRKMMLDLRDSVRDMRVDEIGVHFHLSGHVDRDRFLSLIDDAALLAQATHRRAAEILDEERELEDSFVFTPMPGALEAVDEAAP